MAITNGGPAFPRATGVVGYGEYTWRADGMSLRDYFAAHALNSVYFDTRLRNEAAEVADMARLAYRVADALLAERERQP